MSRRSSRGIIQKRAFSPDPDQPTRRSASVDSEGKKKRKLLSPSNIIPPRYSLTHRIEILKPKEKPANDDLVRVKHDTDNNENVDVSTYHEAVSPSDSAISSHSGSSENQHTSLDLPDIVHIPDEITYMGEHMEVYSKIMDEGVFSEGNNILKITLPVPNREKLELVDKTSILYTKTQEITKELIATVQQYPQHYSPLRSSAIKLYESSKLLSDLLGSTNTKHFEILRITHQQEIMMESDSRKKHSDAILYNFTFANALELLDNLNLDVDLAKIHLWFMHKLNEKSLAAYIMLLKYLLSIDERYAIYFQLHYPPFNVVTQFNVQKLIDPYAELIMNMKQNTTLATAKTNVVVTFDKDVDDKFKHIGLFSRALHNLGCEIFHLASHDDNTIQNFIKECQEKGKDSISPVFFIIKIIFESITISPKAGTICYMPRIECSLYKNGDNCKKLILSCRNSNDQLPTYFDFGCNGLTPAFFVKMYMERIQFFMEDMIPNVLLTSL